MSTDGLLDGFSFGGRHSMDDMELYTVLKSKPLFAEPKTAFDEIGGMDGELDYSRTNPKKRLFFRPRLIEYECHFIGEDGDMESLAAKEREIAQWLVGAGRARLICDDEPDVFYLAAAVNLFNVEAVTRESGTFPLVFRCDPYRYALREVRQSADIAGSGAVRTVNRGYYAPPVITITGDAPDGVTLTLGNAQLSTTQGITGAGALEFDMHTMMIKKDGVPVNHTASGVFFEFSPGENNLAVTGNNLDAQVTVCYRPRYL